MQDQDFYNLSSKVNTVLLLAKKLLALNLLRYRHIVDNSPKGFDCTYAKMSKRHFYEAKSDELSQLKEIQSVLNDLIERIENETQDCI